MLNIVKQKVPRPLKKLLKQARRRLPVSSSVRNFNYGLWISKYDTVSQQSLQSMHKEIESFDEKPLISVVLPVYNPSKKFLASAIESVIAQVYPHWQLCVVDDHSKEEWVREFLIAQQEKDCRIKAVFSEANRGISEASNAGLARATGDWVTFLDHDDELSNTALFHLARTLNRHPDCKLIYSDEDKIDTQGNRSEPHFKSSWNPDLLYSQNYVCHLVAYRKDLIDRVGGFRTGVEGSQDHDLLLRTLPHVQAADIRHIPQVLYHWRLHQDSTAQTPTAKSYTTEAGLNALKAHFSESGAEGVTVQKGLLPNTYRVGWPVPTPAPLVSLLIPTRDRLPLIQNAIQSILAKTIYPNLEILILDNGSQLTETRCYFAEVQKGYPNVRVLSCNGPFNFSAINNYGVTEAKGEVVGFINNDIEVIAPGWLDEMVSHAIRPDIGCVGAKLYYSDDTVQHAGVVLGIGGVAGHGHKRFSRDHNGYFSRLKLTQNMSAVTAACLVMRKSLFIEVGGFDEENLKVAFNDVDLCLKVREAGYRNLWTPYAELYHHESLSRGKEDTREKLERFRAESKHMINKWGHELYKDPYYNPNLSLMAEDFRMAWRPRTQSGKSKLAKYAADWIPKPIARRLIHVLEFGS